MPLRLDGKKLNLKFDFNALADAEELLGKPIHRLMEQDDEGDVSFGIAELRVLLYVSAQGGLRSKKEAGAMMTPDNLGEIATAIMEALSAAFPDQVPEDADAPLAEAAGSGTTSSD